MFSAGQVSAVLEGRFSPAGFMAFDAAMKKSAASMEAGEKRMTAAGTRGGKAMALMGKTAALAAGGGVLALGLALGKSVKLAADFEQQLSRLKSATQASASTMAQLKKGAMEAGAATKYSALDAAKAQTELALGGMKVKTIMGGGLKAALSLAAAGEIELNDAATIVVDTMNKFSLQAEDAAHVADAFAAAAASSTTDVGDLGRALTQGGGAAALAGVSFDDSLAALTALSTYAKGSDAGTSLKAFFLNIATASPKAKEAMKGLGLSIFDAKGQIKSMPAIAENLRSAFGNLTKEQFTNKAGVIAGSDAIRTLYALYKAGPDTLQGYIDKQHETGLAAEVAAEKQDNLKGKIENLKGSLETAGIALGEGLLPGLTEGAEKLTDTINEMAASGELEKIGKDLGDITVALVEMGPAVTEGLGGAITGISKTVEAFGVGVNGVIAATISPVEFLMTAVLALGKAWNAMPFGKGAEIDLSGLEDALDKVNDFRQEFTAGLANLVTKDGKPEVEFKIKGNSADAERALKRVQGMGISEKVMKILGKDISAGAKIRQLRALDIPEKLARILGQNADAIAKIGSVQAALNALRDKHIVIETTRIENVRRTGSASPGADTGRRATGRGPVGAERALVGEGKGPELHVDEMGRMQVIDRPTIMDLGAGDYVIPYGDPSQKGRALGLMLDMFGITGYAKGRKPKGKPKGKSKPLPIPDAVKFGGVPADELDKSRDDAREAYQDRKERVRKLDVKIRDQQKAVGEAKGTDAKRKARAKLRDLQEDRRNYAQGKGGVKSSLAEMRKRWQELQRQSAELHRVNREIEKLNTQQETDRTKMATASKTGDAAAWKAARDHRGGLLATLRDKYALALKYAKPGTNFAAEVEGKLAGIQGDIADLGSEDFTSPFEGGLSADERKRLEGLQAAQALASLTAPLDDDKAAATATEQFLTQMLGAAISDPNRGGPAAIRDLADQVKQARDNVASFAGGGTSNDNADVQAQLEQEREAHRVTRRESEINRLGLATFQGAGDIGMGGPRIVIQTLHPGDPATLRAIGDAATAGIGLQPAVGSSRTSLGL